MMRPSWMLKPLQPGDSRSDASYSGSKVSAKVDAASGQPCRTQWLERSLANRVSCAASLEPPAKVHAKANAGEEAVHLVLDQRYGMGCCFSSPSNTPLQMSPTSSCRPSWPSGAALSHSACRCEPVV